MNRRTLHRVGLIAAIAATVPLVVGGLAQGTSGRDFALSVVARDTTGVKINTRGNQPYDIVVGSITIQPGGHSGWHSHPGQVIVLVKSGTFTTYDAGDKTCRPEVFRAGEVYVDRGHGHAHIGRNEGTVPTELHVTFIDVPVGGVFRSDAPQSAYCPF